MLVLMPPAVRGREVPLVKLGGGFAPAPEEVVESLGREFDLTKPRMLVCPACRRAPVAERFVPAVVAAAAPDFFCFCTGVSVCALAAVMAAWCVPTLTKPGKDAG